MSQMLWYYQSFLALVLASTWLKPPENNLLVSNLGSRNLIKSSLSITISIPRKKKKIKKLLYC